MIKSSSQQVKYDLILLTVILIWGFNFPILKHVLDKMHPFVVNMFRFIASISAIFLIYAFKKEHLFKWNTIKTNIKSILFLGFLGYFVYQVFFILGISKTTAGNTAIIMASSPVWTALTAKWFTQEKLSNSAWLGLILSIIGAIYISVRGGKHISFDDTFLLGNMITLMAAVCWGSYTTFSKPVTHFIDPKGLTLIGLLISFPFNFAIALPYLNQVVWSEITIYTWLAIIYSGSLSTGVAVVLWTVSVKHVGATHTAVFGNLVPFIAIVASIFILGEQISIEQLVGGSLIVGGLILMRFNR